MKEAITEALRVFEGSLMIVSHDRYFLDHVVDEVMGIRDGRAIWHPGTVSEYLDWELEADSVDAEVGSGDVSPDGKQQDSEKTVGSDTISKNELKRARWRLEEVETRIGELETERDTLNRDMVNPDIYSDGVAIQQVRERLQTVEAELDALMTEWETLQDICM